MAANERTKKGGKTNERKKERKKKTKKERTKERKTANKHEAVKGRNPMIRFGSVFRDVVNSKCNLIYLK